MFQKLLKKIAQELDKVDIQYMVIGGQAILLYGEPRLTKDIDITLGVGIDKFKEVKNVAGKLKFKILVSKAEEFVKNTMVLPVVDEKSGIRVDLIFSFSPYERQAIERANRVKFGSTIVKFASIEDVVIHKIVAGRARDIEDIKSIILKNSNYDIKYITKQLKEFDNLLNKNFLNIFRKLAKEIK